MFLIAGIGKLLDLAGARNALFGFGVPARVARLAGPLIPIAELATVAALLFQPTAQWGGVAALVLLLLFLGGIARALARGEAPSCHCFGIFHSARAGPGAINRNAALALLAAVVAFEGPGPTVSSWISDHSAAALAVILLASLAAGLASLVRRHRREIKWLRNELSTTQARLAAVPPGLPIDGLAPKFDVPEVGGGRLTLDGLTARGVPVLLVFMDPGCKPCTALVPDLARWQRTLPERLTIGVISSDQSEENQHAKHGITRIAAQKELEVSFAYRVRGTPAAVLISPAGRVISSLAQGPNAIEALVRLTLQDEERLGRHNGRNGSPPVTAATTASE